jgi:hypothetical protein
MIRFFLVLVVLAVQPAHAEMPELPGLIYVGEIPLGCERVTNEKGTVLTPPGFKISPNDAMKLAIEKARIRCNSIFQFVIYADSLNYYIFHAVVLSDDKTRKEVTSQSLAGHTVVVHGQTGNVVDNRRK